MSTVPPLRPRPAACPLRGPEDALAVVLTAASEPQRPETVCLVLDHAHRGLGCIVLVGEGPVQVAAEMLEHLASQEPTVAALVMASVRPGRFPAPTRGDLLTFHDLRERFDEVAVDLLDWFVIAGRRAASLAELTDSQPRWRG